MRISKAGAILLSSIAVLSAQGPAPGPTKATFSNVIKLNAYVDVRNTPDPLDLRFASPTSSS